MFSYGCWCRQSNFYRLWCSPSNTAHWSWCRINFCSYIASTDQSSVTLALMILTKTEISLTLMGIHSSFEWSRRCFCKCPCIYINRRRFFRCQVVATDAEGNETTQIFEIDIQDISTPTIIAATETNTLTTTADMDSQCYEGTTAVTTFGATESTGCSSWCCEGSLSGTDADQFCNWWGHGCTAIGGCKNLRRHQQRTMFWYHCYCDRCIRYTRREKCSVTVDAVNPIYRLWCSPSNTAHWSWCRINFCSYICIYWSVERHVQRWWYLRRRR